MGSLTDLNTYAQDLIEATDERNPGPKLWPNVPLDLNQTSLTGTFAIDRVIEIEEIVRPADAQLRFQVDVSSVPLATVSWPTIPAGCTVVNPSTGVYYITGIDSIAIWDQVKNPNIVLPVDFYGNFEYYVSWIWFDDTGYQSEEYTVGTYVPVALFASEFSVSLTPNRLKSTLIALDSSFAIAAELEITGLGIASETDWLADQINSIDDAPLIVGDDLGIWTYSVVPSNLSTVDSLSLSGTVTGLTTSYNAGTKTLTLSGTKPQVNAGIDLLQFDASTTKVDFSFNYSVYNSTAPATIFTRTQSARCMNLQRLTDARGTATYQTAISSLIGTSSPIIYDPDYTGLGTYTITITPTQLATISNITSTGLTRWGFEQQYTDSVSAHNGSSDPKFETIAYGQNFEVMTMGVPGDDTNITDGGALYWFTKSGTTWTNVKIFNGSSNQLFLGAKLAMADNDIVVVSGYGFYSSDPNDPIGRVYIFERVSPTNWNLTQTLSTPGGDVEDAWFGFHVSISRDGNVIAVAEPDDTDSGNTRLGRVHIWNRTGSFYSYITTINDPESDTSTDFSRDQCKLHPNGNELVVTDGSGPSDDTYFYAYNGTSWSLHSSLSNTDRRIEWIPNSPTRYSYINGNTIYVMSKSVSSYTQTNSQVLTQTLFNNLKFSYNGNRAIAQINGPGTIFTDRTFLLLDFNDSTNTFTENRIIDMSSYFNNIYTFAINDDGNEMIFGGELTNNSNGFVTYTFAPKPNSFNPSTKVFTIEGTKTEVNNDIDTVRITTAAGVSGPLTFDVSVVTPEANTQTKQFNANYSS